MLLVLSLEKGGRSRLASLSEVTEPDGFINDDPRKKKVNDFEKQKFDASYYMKHEVNQQQRPKNTT